MATGRIGTTPVLQVRWSKAPTANTTSLTGLDDNSVTLTYSVGYEAVYRNGVLLSRGNDYTATNGTTVTLIDATITGDIIEIFANQTVPLSDTFSQTVADGRFIKNTLTTTTGDIIYASAANTPARLGIGSSAQVLTVSGGIPAWATPAAGGKVLQVVTATFSTETTTTSTSYGDTGVTVNITPSSASSKVLVLVSGDVYTYASNDLYTSTRLMRGATALQEHVGATAFYSASGTYQIGGTDSWAYLDSPSTTSSTTYKIQFATRNTTTSRICSNGSDWSIVCLEIGA